MSPLLSFSSTVLEVSGSGHVIFPSQEFPGLASLPSAFDIFGLVEIDLTTDDVTDVTLMGGHLVCVSCTLNLTVFDGIVTGNATLQSINVQSNDPLYVGHNSIITLHDTFIEYLDIECVSKCNILISGNIWCYNNFRLISSSEDAALITRNTVLFNLATQNFQVYIPFFNHGYLIFQSNHEILSCFEESNSPHSYIQFISNTGQLFFNSLLLTISSFISPSNSLEETATTFHDSEIFISNFNIDTSNLIVNHSRILIDLLTLSNSSLCFFKSNVSIVSRGVFKDNCLFHDGTLISKGVLEFNTSVVYLQSSTLVFEGMVKFPSKFEFQSLSGTSLVVFNSNDIIHVINDSVLDFYCDCAFDSPINFSNSVITFNGVVTFSNRVSLLNSTLIFNDNVCFTASSAVGGDSNSFFMPNRTLTVMGTWDIDSLQLTSEGSFHFVKSSFLIFPISVSVKAI
ncbi:hypothetical protein GEMRC1_006469 [Eukaryota sp. GEM-RC1]